MAVIFKSNVKATTTIKKKIGFQGPIDFTASADFSNNIYLKNGKSVVAEDILSVEDQLAFLVLDNDAGDISLSPNGKLRRSFLVEHGIYGALCSSSNTNFFFKDRDCVQLPEENVITYALYACKGSVDLKEKSNVTILRGSGTLKDPLIFNYKNSTILKVTQSEDAENIVCTAIAGMRVPFAPFGIQTTNIDVKKYLDVSLIKPQEFTLVMRVIEPIRGIDEPMTGIATYIKIIQDDDNALTIAKARNSDLRTNVLKQGEGEADWQAADVNQIVDTLAIRVKDGQFRVVLNGILMPEAQVKLDSSFVASQIYLMAADEQWGSDYPESALLNVVVYDRALSNDEMVQSIFR